MKRQDGEWWIEHGDDGDRKLREQFAGGKIKTVAFIRNGWFGMPRGSLISPQQAATVARRSH